MEQSDDIGGHGGRAVFSDLEGDVDGFVAAEFGEVP